MENFLKSTKGRIAVCIIAALFALMSFFIIGKKASSPETYQETIEKLDEKKVDVAEMSAVAAGTSVAVAAVPGDSTSPLANKIADFSGYMMLITTLILCEKYMLTLAGALAFKILIPVACIAVIIYQLSGYPRWKAFATKLLVFAIAFFLVVPASVRVSDKIVETYEMTTEYSVEEAQREQAAIEAKVPDPGNEDVFVDKIKNTFSSVFDKPIDKAEKMLNRFIEFIAVMFITNLVIPVAVFFIFLNLIKYLIGVDYSSKAVSGAGKMTSLLHGHRKQLPSSEK